MNIRRAKPGEAAALSALARRAKAHWGYDAAFLAACEAELRVTASEIAASPVYVCEQAGKTLGFYRLEIADGAADIALFFVEPAAIGRGAGRALWRHLVAQASEAGATRITIESDPFAEGFYRRMGARRIGTAPTLSIPGRDLPLLEFRLL